MLHNHYKDRKTFEVMTLSSIKVTLIGNKLWNIVSTESSILHMQVSENGATLLWKVNGWKIEIVSFVV